MRKSTKARNLFSQATWNDFASAYTPYAVPIGAACLLLVMFVGLTSLRDEIGQSYFLQHFWFGNQAHPDPPYSMLKETIFNLLCFFGIAGFSVSAAVIYFGPKHVFTSSWGNVVYSFILPHIGEKETNKKIAEILESNPDADLKEYQIALWILIHHIDRTKPATPTPQTPTASSNPATPIPATGKDDDDIIIGR